MIKIPTNPKALRIPYVGGKQSIAYSIMLFLHQRHPNAKYFYDMFGGGASMSLMAQQFGYKVFYNEIKPGLCNLLNFLKDNKIPASWYEWVSREKFFQHKKGDDPYSQMIRICYSFGYKDGNDYLFAKDLEWYKKLGHQIVVYEDQDAIKEYNSKFNVNLPPLGKSRHSRRLNFIKFVHNSQSKIKNYLKMDISIKQLQRLQQLERLEQLQQLQQLQRLEVSNLSYDQVNINTPKEDTIIYVDPPYRSSRCSKKNGGYNDFDFDYEKHDHWFKNLKYHAYMSEYGAPFEKVFALKKSNLLQAGENRRVSIENIYWNGV